MEFKIVHLVGRNDGLNRVHFYLITYARLKPAPCLHSIHTELLPFLPVLHVKKCSQLQVGIELPHNKKVVL